MKSIHKMSIWLSLGLMSCLVACQQPETTAPVTKDIADAIFASGHIEQEVNYTVSAKAEGIITTFPVQEGDQVRQGDLIAKIESDVQDNQVQDAAVVYQDALQDASPHSPQLQSLQVQLKQAEEQLKFDQDNYARYQELMAKNSVSQLEFDKMELQYQSSHNNLNALKENYADLERSLQLSVKRSRTQLSTQETLLQDYRLTTGTSGQVIQVYKKQGELVRRGEPIARIGSGAYQIKLFVSEDDITKVNLGQEVAVNLNTYPDKAFPARVSKIYPGFDEVEQSYIVEAVFSNIPEKMFSGTQLTANIKTGDRKNVLVIPTEYVSKGSFVILEDGTEKQIEIGSSSNTWTEVVAGISLSDVIIKPQN